MKCAPQDVDDVPAEDWPTVHPRSTPSAMFPLGLPELVPIPGTDNYRLKNDFAVVTSDGERDDIPAGFVTDGASIPRPFWVCVGNPFDPDYICEALVHDWRWRKCRTWAQRTKANARFRKILEEHHTASCWDRFALTTGVWFGKLGNALVFWR